MAKKKDDDRGMGLKERDSEELGRKLFKEGYYHRSKGGGYSIGKPRKRAKR